MSGKDLERVVFFWLFTSLGAAVLCAPPGIIIGLIGWGWDGLWSGALVGMLVGAGLMALVWIYAVIRISLTK
jgi:hypothetical protein